MILFTPNQFNGVFFEHQMLVICYVCFSSRCKGMISKFHTPVQQIACLLRICG